MSDNSCNQSSNPSSIRQLNSYHYGKNISLLRFLVIFLAISLGGLSCFLGYLVFKQNRTDLVYFVTNTGTHSGIKTENPNNVSRESFELENFAIRFIQDGFAHSENNYQENIERALTVMNNSSRVTLKKIFSDDSLFQVYKESNGVTTVHIDKIFSDTTSYPYITHVYFKTDLKFLTSQGKIKNHSYHQGISLTMETTARCRKNPYGLMITDLTFLKNEEK
ncbi:VirB8/TrbF family protein [Candidatus Cardinium hertigii]|uniref:VirB8/TrbF family protein n=1 Tax=Candidatus Cardinium hertigii TaxID=247481 RepID=UPI003D7E5AF9